jgi:Mg2+-importing ATPase
LLLWTTIAVTITALTIPFLGPLASAFGFAPLSALQMGAVVIVVVGYIAATEGAKAWFYKTRNPNKPVAVAWHC